MDIWSLVDSVVDAVIVPTSVLWWATIVIAWSIASCLMGCIVGRAIYDNDVYEGCTEE